MKLGEFILTRLEPILVEWEAFASTLLPAAARLDRTALRDHAKAMLQAIAQDLSEVQSAEAGVLKSRGQAPVVEGAPRTAAQSHALYGDLSNAQLALLRERIRSSPFDAQRVNTERLRRQTDLIRTLRELQTERGATVATATTALRRWHDRVMQSPLPGFAAYSDHLVRNACEQFAAVHNTTTAEQRQHAVRVLKDYELDLRSLTAQH